MKTKRHILSAVAILALLSACQDFQEARRSEDDTLARSRDSRVPNTPIITESDKPWLVGETLHDADPLPDILKVQSSLTIARPVSLRDAAIQASRQTGIPVRIAPDAEQDDLADSLGSGGNQTPITFNGTNLPPPPVASALASAAASRTRSSFPAWRGSGNWLAYSGTREGVFQAIATRFGVWKRWVDGHIEFFRTETRTFTIPAFPGDTNANTSIVAYTGGGSGSSGGSMSGGGMSGGGGMGGGGMGGSSGGSSGQSAGMASISNTSKTNRWKTIERTAQIVSGGAQVVADDGLGTLSVTGTPDQVARIEDWMHGVNESLMKQVAVEVHVYTVKITRETNYGWSPQFAFKSHNGLVGLTSTPATIPSIQSGDTPFRFGASILDTGRGTGGLFSGSNVVFQALNELGNVTEQYDRSVVTTNGVTAPLQNGINTTYLASTVSTLATNAGTANSLSPGVVMSGFMGSVTPKIVDNRILLHTNFLLQTLLAVQNITSNGSSIQAPKTSSTSLDDTVALPSGSTLVLSGYVDDATSRSRTGVGSALNWLFGGGGDAQVTKTHVVVTVEARTL
ncbi:pilus assembly protein PilN [Gluconacetobacter sp. 1c LMG 22058]|uniref:Pilus assembly protein PilN n=1 Tax=Gluconacetobacter dulcium TaxID=2729096 RepID=A0A7W4K3H8_9PROT|nr:pilus assembly protein PilN [Gluconacetobacter dulcium]MBB2199502.1 pilus assembly protein PilN [Gluconacetobacter dulcium]